MSTLTLAGQRFAYSELGADPFGLGRTGRSTLALHTESAAVVLSAIASLDGVVPHIHLIPPDRDPSEFGLADHVVEPDPASSGSPATTSSVATSWTLYTSGTTGTPKAIVHTLDSLSRTVAPGAGTDWIWGLLYDPNRMAGLQVLLQAWRSGAAIVAAQPGASLSERLQELVDGGVSAMSATPTLWRQILQSPISNQLNLRQITLGGEIADQPVLDALAARFPDARIVHVFAATETGAAFSVSDRRAGFPRSFLDDGYKGIKLRIVDGVLEVWSPGVDLADDDGFVSTGDCVELTDDRVYFRGRGTGVVNIGGVSVWPEQVEEILRQHPEVVEATVTSRANPMSGNILVASVRLVDDADRNGAGRRIRKWVRTRCPSYQVPASITVVDDIKISHTGKAQR